MVVSYYAFERPDQAEKFIGALFDHGATQEDISVVAKEGVFGEDARKLVERVVNGISTTTPSDAAIGAVEGAALGTGVGLIAALASVFVPGIGFVLGGGAMATALAGAFASAGAGAVAGGVAGYLKDLGMPPEAKEDIERHYKENRVIVAYTLPEGCINPDTLWTLAHKYDALESPPNSYGPFQTESAIIEAELEHVGGDRVTRYEPSR